MPECFEWRAGGSRASQEVRLTIYEEMRERRRILPHK